MYPFLRITDGPGPPKKDLSVFDLSKDHFVFLNSDTLLLNIKLHGPA